ncbi:hypothetical protein [Acinetobacter bouvetii]|uniref:Lipoprotein n=1 Tax=Acinetobacter bouvetii TaxID=202951 RepID=A0A811GFS9_9GAMM|nr:hypothetical protein [Acinetobacter bouvetii]CAB1220018.1 hypothetical protein SFB21_2495 [Acinetobacter bouvetii]
MNKPLLASLCVAALALTACDKKPNEAPASSASAPATTTSAPANPQTTTTALSSNNVQDIKNDLIEIQTLSKNRSQEASDLQNKANQAAEKGDKATLTATVAEMKTYIGNFNRDLDNLNLKSTELNAVRGKIKESNNLGIQLAEESIAEKADMNKINELRTQASQLQKELVTEMQALESKAKTVK